MPKDGFNRDHRVIGDIMKNNPGLRAAIKAEAASLGAEIHAHEITEYITDRYVNGLKFFGHEQALHGTVTKAVGRRGKTLDANPG